MFRRFAAVLFVLMLALPAQAQEEPIQNTISRQIDAFLIDDFPKAFTFASPSIQGMFRTPENFGRMVSQGYPMVWRPADVQYLDLREENGVLIQKVLITDQEGGQHVLDYRMIETEAGWKINGVSLLDSSAVAA